MSDSQDTPDFEKKPDPPAAADVPAPGAEPTQPVVPPVPPQADPSWGQPPAGQQPYPPPPAPGYPQYAGQTVMPPDQERLWGGAAHWSALVASLIGLAFLGPLIVMLTKGNESAFVRRSAVESLNFQLSILIYEIVSVVLIFVLVGILLLPIVIVLWLVFTILGTVKGSQGQDYRYPLTLRMVH